MLFSTEIKQTVAEAMLTIYQQKVDISNIQMQPTKKEFDGDLTVLIFNLSKQSGKSPELVGIEIGSYLVEHCAEVDKFNVVKGFLNIVIKTDAWLSLFSDLTTDQHFWNVIADSSFIHAPVLVEYSSPNTNKPLHLGHIRNNLIGYSVAELLKATGNHVKKVNLVND